MRFSRSTSDDWFKRFRVLHVDVTNSYFGMVAHILQDSRVLRALLGTRFFFVDRFVPKSARWATQITYELEKLAE